MEINCHIELGICRYLEEFRISPRLLLAMEILAMPDDMGSFWKISSERRQTREIRMACNKAEYNLLFTKSFERGEYIGETAETCITNAFFRYICR